jgi:hypothetical protein
VVTTAADTVAAVTDAGVGAAVIEEGAGAGMEAAGAWLEAAGAGIEAVGEWLAVAPAAASDSSNRSIRMSAGGHRRRRVLEVKGSGECSRLRVAWWLILLELVPTAEEEARSDCSRATLETADELKG